MQALVKLKEAKAKEKCLCTEEEKKHAEQAKKAKVVVREAQKAGEVTAVEPGPKVK